MPGRSYCQIIWKMSYPHIVYKWQMLLPFDGVEEVKPHKLHVAAHYVYGR